MRRLPLALAALACVDGGVDPTDTDAPVGTLRRVVGRSLRGHHDGVGEAVLFGEITGLELTEAAIWIADGAGTLRRFDRASGEVRTVFGSPGITTTSDGPLPDARAAAPRGLWDAGDRLWIGDGSALRAMDAAGVWVQTGDPGTPGHRDGDPLRATLGWFLGDLAPAGGEVWIADRANHAIRAYDPASGALRTVAGRERGDADGAPDVAAFGGPTALLPGDGGLWVTDSENDRLAWINLDDASTRTVARGLGRAAGFAPHPSGALVGLGLEPALILVNPTTGAVSRALDDPGPPRDGRTPALGGALVPPVGDGTWLWFADATTHALRQIDLRSGETTTVAGPIEPTAPRDGPPDTCRLDAVLALATDGARTFVAEAGGGVRVVDADGCATLATGLPRPTALAWDGGNTLWIGTLEAGLWSLDLASGDPPTVRVPGMRVGGVVADPDRVWFTDPRGRRVLSWTEDTGAVPLAGGLGGHADGVGDAARFTNPGALTRGPAGLLVADGRTVRAVSEDGGVRTLAGDPDRDGGEDGATPTFSDPAALAIVDGALWVAEPGAHRIRRVDLDTGATDTPIGDPVWHAGVTAPRPAWGAPIERPVALAVVDGALRIGAEHAILEVRWDVGP